MSRWDIELDHVRERQDKGCDQQAEVFVRVCRLAKEVGKHVGFLPQCCFGVALAILKEQLDDQLERFVRSMSPELQMVESDALMVGERRATNHPWAAGTVLKTVAEINGVPLSIMRKICESSFRRLFGRAK